MVVCIFLSSKQNKIVVGLPYVPVFPILSEDLFLENTAFWDEFFSFNEHPDLLLQNMVCISNRLYVAVLKDKSYCRIQSSFKKMQQASFKIMKWARAAKY